MRGIIAFCVLIAVPALAAFGHDAYVVYDQHNPSSFEEFKTLFSLSDFGYLFHTYDKDSFRLFESMVSDGTITEEMAHYIISLKAFHAGLALAGICYLYMIIAFLYGIWPFKSIVNPALSGGKEGFSRQNREKGKKLSYKRK